MQIELVQHVPAPRERVFDFYTDHEGWTRWAGVREVVLRQKGDPPPNGLGAIRVIRARGIAVEEEVTAFDRPSRMEYRVVAGVPIRDHLGEVRFEPDGAGTRVLWNIRFRPLVPGTGWLLRRVLTQQLQGMLARLSEHFAATRP
ncbi:MAG TPA: SRPBCC family protein [Myxococcota bacterium]|jgi:uncharacterized protein YndB with AHSA1/START domain|nr:SRPBCC family protein [Myxococcota bacterium]